MRFLSARLLEHLDESLVAVGAGVNIGLCLHDSGCGQSFVVLDRRVDVALELRT
jgi:hypothetical protein